MLFPMKATVIFKPFGGMRQTLASTLVGIHPIKPEAYLFWRFAICSSTSSIDIRPQKRHTAVGYRPWRGSTMHINFMASRKSNEFTTACENNCRLLRDTRLIGGRARLRMRVEPMPNGNVSKSLFPIFVPSNLPKPDEVKRRRQRGVHHVRPESLCGPEGPVVHRLRLRKSTWQ